MVTIFGMIPYTQIIALGLGSPNNLLYPNCRLIDQITYIYILLLVNISSFDSVTRTGDLNKIKQKQWNTTHWLHIERLYVHVSFLYLLFPQHPTTIPNIIFLFKDWSKPIITIDC